jgi:hypothetical protein
MTDNLQLSDLAFQRHILVQALILIDFLLTLTDGSKSKPFYQNAQKAMQYNFTLREEDVSVHRLPLLTLRSRSRARFAVHDHHLLG